MGAPRALLARAPWASATPRRTLIPSAATIRLGWRRCNSQYIYRRVDILPPGGREGAFVPSKHNGEGNSQYIFRRVGIPPSKGKDGDEGCIKHIGECTARVRLPRTEMNKKDRMMGLSFLQLRDACQCPLCVDPQTKQRFFRTSEIPEDITPSRMDWMDHSENDRNKKLRIVWEKGNGEKTGHVTRFRADEIKYPAAYFHDNYVATGSKPRKYWNKLEMEKAQHWISYNDYMTNDDLFLEALDMLSLYGLVFVHRIPDSREMVENIATRMGPLRNTFYGPTWDVRHDPQAKNVAYTNQNLDFHMDLLYTQNPPGFQLLHCLRNSCEGGESLFVDSFAAAADLDDDSWQILSRFKVPYHYNHKHEYYRKTRPVFEMPEDWDLAHSPFMARQLSYVNYSPPFQGPFHFRGDKITQWDQSMRRFIPAMRKFENKIQDPSRIFELKLKPGQCVIFENRRVLHARRAFDMTAGERWLAGAYVDEDAVQSKIFTLKRNSGLFPSQRA